MSRRLLHVATLALVVAAALIWGRILAARDEVAATQGPYGPPIEGAYTFAAMHVTCIVDYVPVVVSARDGRSNRITCAPVKREQQ